VKNPSFYELGETLFVPATHKDLLLVVEGKKIPSLKSLLVDTEDFISDNELPHAKSILKRFEIYGLF